MSNTLREEFFTSGFLSNVRVMDTRSAAKYAQTLKRLTSDYADHPDLDKWTYFKSHLLFSWVVDIARSTHLVTIVQALLGPDIVLWNSFIPVKAPYSEGYFGWHQDATHWPLSPVTDLVSVWIAFVDVDSSRGGMRVIPGTHKLGQLSHESTYDDKSMLRRGQRIVDPFPERDAVEIRYLPGEASVHHTYTIHGSGANSSPHWRFALGLNYASADVRPNEGFPDSALYIAGDDCNTAFLPERAAGKDLGEEELREYQRIISHSSSRYNNTTA